MMLQKHNDSQIVELRMNANESHISRRVDLDRLIR
jgi:hypothetical protein